MTELVEKWGVEGKAKSKRRREPLRSLASVPGVAFNI